MYRVAQSSGVAVCHSFTAKLSAHNVNNGLISVLDKNGVTEVAVVCLFVCLCPRETQAMVSLSVNSVHYTSLYIILEDKQEGSRNVGGFLSTRY